MAGHIPVRSRRKIYRRSVSRSLLNRRAETFQDVPAVVILWIQLKRLAIAFDGVGLSPAFGKGQGYLGVGDGGD